MRKKNSNPARIALCCLVLMLAGCKNPAPHKVRFLNEPCIKPYERYRYLTCDPLRVSIDETVYEVPMYFNTDLASIPRWYWSVLSPSYSSIVYPGILHDYFYSCRQPAVSRRFADDVFYASLLSQGLSNFTAIKMYLAVRLFGGFHYQKHENCLLSDIASISTLCNIG